MANTKSIDFESSSSQYAYITDANQTGLDLSGDFTIEWWQKLETLPSVAGNSYAVLTKFTTSQAYRILLLDTGKLQVYVSGDGTSTNRDYWTSTNDYVGVGTWVHYAVTYDLSEREFTVYQNGEAFAGSTTKNGTVSAINNSSDPVYIGAYGTGPSLYFDGLIDEVRVWSDVRTPTEIADNYDKEDPAGDNLVAYWKFNDSALDETANDNDLTLVNSPVYSTDVPFSGGVSRRGGFMAFF